MATTAPAGAPAGPPLWRSMLYVPVNVARFVDKAAGAGADAVILDLEDSIVPADKEEARTLVGAAAARCSGGGTDVVVRVNQPLELAVRDVEAVVSPAVRGLMLPKVEGVSHVRLLADLVATVEAARGMEVGATTFHLIVETPGAFRHLWDIAAAHPRVVALSLGGEDFATATGSSPDADVLLHPKQQVVLAARAAGIAPIGVIGTVADYQDVEGWREAARRSRRFGFSGGTCVHPALVPVLNEGFSPSPDEVAAAERVVAGFERAQAEGRGSVQVDGRMVDLPIVERARRLLDVAARLRR